MFDFILFGILWTFAIYGFIEVLKTIYFVLVHTKLKSDGIYLILAVKNQEEKIEGVLRSILFRFIYGKEESINDIIITDLGSTDNTPVILEKLGKDYDSIEILNWKECKELIDSSKRKGLQTLCEEILAQEPHLKQIRFVVLRVDTDSKSSYPTNIKGWSRKLDRLYQAETLLTIPSKG